MKVQGVMAFILLPGLENLLSETPTAQEKFRSYPEMEKYLLIVEEKVLSMDP